MSVVGIFKVCMMGNAFVFPPCSPEGHIELLHEDDTLILTPRSPLWRGNGRMGNIVRVGWS